MSETMPDTDLFGDPAAEDAAQEFEPNEPADPEEPETLPDDAVPLDPGEADVVDVAEQRKPVGGDDDDDYDRKD